MSKPRVSILPIVVVAIAALVSSARSGIPATVVAPHQIDFVSLEQSLDPLKSAFNKGSSKPRILILVSPT
ncbi:MAG: hypothetical protein JF614_11665 [Acidobacteria bacterium]|nr:hypothetical protein [Acidobacteriota bacterium]